MRVGVRENFAAGPVSGAVDPSDRVTGCSMSRSSTCGSRAVSANVFSLAATRPASRNRPNASYTDRSAHHSTMTALTASRLFNRSPLRPKPGSRARSGRPITSHSLRQWLSRAMARYRLPSRQSYTSQGWVTLTWAPQRCIGTSVAPSVSSPSQWNNSESNRQTSTC